MPRPSGYDHPPAHPNRRPHLVVDRLIHRSLCAAAFLCQTSSIRSGHLYKKLPFPSRIFSLTLLFLPEPFCLRSCGPQTVHFFPFFPPSRKTRPPPQFHATPGQLNIRYTVLIFVIASRPPCYPVTRWLHYQVNPLPVTLPKRSPKVYPAASSELSLPNSPIWGAHETLIHFQGPRET